MVDEKKYKEIWSVSEARLRQYFEQTYRIAFCDGQAKIGTAKIEIVPLPPNTIMKVPIPRCQIEITGMDQSADDIHRKFVLNFLSAGG